MMNSIQKQNSEAAPYRVLFVDDELNILNSLKRLLRSRRSRWEMHFASSGREALDILSVHSVDMVVTDMKMPEMDGVGLLCEVKKLFPETVRIILSGYSDVDLIIKSTLTAHQYLAKPCDISILENVIERTSRLFTPQGLSGAFRRSAALCCIPAEQGALSDLKNELKQENPSLPKIADIIEKDQGLLSKILQLNYSAFFGYKRDISNTYDAVSLLGLEIINSLVHTSGIFNGSAEAGTEDNLSAAACMEAVSALAEMSGISKKDAGYLKMAAMLFNSGNKILKAVSGSLPDANILAAFMFGIWGFPDIITEPIRHYTQPGLYDGPFRKETALLHAAVCAGKRKTNPESAAGADTAILNEFGLGDFYRKITA